MLEYVLQIRIKRSGSNKVNLFQPLDRSVNVFLEYSDPFEYLIEKLVETISKNSLEEQVYKCLEELSRADDFDVDYQISPFRNLISNPNVVSIYLTAFIIEKMINHKDVIDIFGSDEEIYHCINNQVKKHLGV